jgi:hypothetical protein
MMGGLRHSRTNEPGIGSQYILASSQDDTEPYYPNYLSHGEGSTWDQINIGFSYGADNAYSETRG